MKTHNDPFVSVLISTYNSPHFLERCLNSYTHQSYKNFEIIVTDDGSDEKTERLVKRFKEKSTIEVRHVWQEDQGNRTARARNLGIAASNGEYLLFTDQDCIADKDLLADHIQKARRGHVVQGNRRLLSKKTTEFLLRFPAERISDFELMELSRKFYPESFFVHGIFRHIGALVDCNLSGFKEDFLAVNMFDENYVGWGGQDFDLGYRLKKKGYRLDFFRNRSFVYHLFHQSSRNLFNANYRRLYKKIFREFFFSNPQE
jgi:glycosyltransferase involved in cell wall biosynthesis